MSAPFGGGQVFSSYGGRHVLPIRLSPGAVSDEHVSEGSLVIVSARAESVPAVELDPVANEVVCQPLVHSIPEIQDTLPVGRVCRYKGSFTERHNGSPKNIATNRSYGANPGCCP